MVASVVLVSTDQALEKSVHDAVASIHDCHLKVTDCVESATASDAAILVCHLSAIDDQQQIRQVLSDAKSGNDPRGVVIVADQYDPSQAIQYLRQGAVDYLSRPLDMRRLALLTEVITWRQRHGISKCQDPAASTVSSQDDLAGIIAGSLGEIGAILDEVRTIAPLDTTTLITGETGTGKSRLARLIHEHSPRSEQPLMTISCGAMSATIAESELFGHARGAFTGADNVRVGKCEAVGGGTLVLDDIDALPPEIQAKLLRVVDERLFEPVGSNRTVEFKARLIVATNRSLEDEMAAGRFRQDLYYRLNVAALHLPPLRERRSAIAPLAQTWLVAFCKHYHFDVMPISKEAMAAMTAYDWPGNVRELRNVIERAAAHAKGRAISLLDLPETIQAVMPTDDTAAEPPEDVAGSWIQAKVDSEMRAILQALTACKNNRSRAARVLGISRPTLYKKMHQYGLI